MMLPPSPESEELVANLTRIEQEVMAAVFEYEDEGELDRIVCHLVCVLDKWFEAGEERAEQEQQSQP